MRCPTCGNELEAGRRFCGRCGTDVSGPPLDTAVDEGRSERPPAAGERSVRPDNPGARSHRGQGDELAARQLGDFHQEAPARPLHGSWYPPAPALGGEVAVSEARVSWLSRVGAYLIDLLVLGVVVYVALVVASLIAGHVVLAGSGRSPFTPAAEGIGVAANLAYFVPLGGSRSGQTLGYRAMGIAVRDGATGGVLGFRKAFVRCLLRLLLYSLLVLPGLANDLWPLFDPRRQTIADKAVGARVVRRRSGQRSP